jgi:predicted XRE-type DNA-binding protein
VKAQLVFKIDGLLKERGLKQVEAAKLFGAKQPDVSKMPRGEFRQFSVERLLRSLVALRWPKGTESTGTHAAAVHLVDCRSAPIRWP